MNINWSSLPFVGLNAAFLTAFRKNKKPQTACRILKRIFRNHLNIPTGVILYVPARGVYLTLAKQNGGQGEGLNAIFDLFSLQYGQILEIPLRMTPDIFYRMPLGDVVGLDFWGRRAEWLVNGDCVVSSGVSPACKLIKSEEEQQCHSHQF